MFSYTKATFDMLLMLAKLIPLHQHCLLALCTFCLKKWTGFICLYFNCQVRPTFINLDWAINFCAYPWYYGKLKYTKIVMRSVREIRITNIHYVLYILFALNIASAKEVTPSQRTSRKTCNPLKQLHCNIRCTLGIIYYSYKCHWANIRNPITCLVYYAHSEIASVL